jgi:hypothetical protein
MIIIVTRTWIENRAAIDDSAGARNPPLPFLHGWLVEGDGSRDGYHEVNYEFLGFEAHTGLSEHHLRRVVDRYPC